MKGTASWRSWKEILLYGVVCIGGLIAIFPLFWMISTALKTSPETIAVPLKWLPSRPILENFAEVWTARPFARYFLNSTIMASACSLMALFTSSIAGYVFSQYDGTFFKVLFYIILGTMMIPSFMLIIPLYIIFVKMRLVNTYPGLILPGGVSAFGVFLMRQYMMTIPNDLIDAATLDGCGELRIYWHIITPLCKPAFVTLGVLVFVWQWNSFLWPLVITNTDNMRVITAGISAFSSKYYTTFNLLMASSTIAIAPLLFLYCILQRYFVEGMTLTGMK